MKQKFECFISRKLETLATRWTINEWKNIIVSTWPDEHKQKQERPGDRANI